MRYARLFGISIAHSYYVDGVCPDFLVDPAPDTCRLLKNHRCLARRRTDGTVVATETDGTGRPFLPIDGEVTLTFRMRPRNGLFPLFTSLAAIEAQPAPLYTPAPGASQGPRELTLTSRATPLQIGVFAEIEIPSRALSPTGDAPVEFRIYFEAKKLRWQYYCVTDLKLDGKELSIVDADSSPAAVLFSPVNRTDLNQNPDPSDPVAGRLAQQYPDLKRLRFISDELVPCRQAPRRQVELRLDGNRFPEPLPNPSIAHYSPLAVTVDGKPSQQMALFQVVTYISHSFSKKGE